MYLRCSKYVTGDFCHFLYKCNFHHISNYILCLFLYFVVEMTVVEVTFLEQKWLKLLCLDKDNFITSIIFSHIKFTFLFFLTKLQLNWK